MTTETLMHARMDVWRTSLTVTARSDDPGAPCYLDHTLRSEVLRLDSAANRFSDRSEITTVNRSAGAWSDVSWHFVDVLTAALDAAVESDGLVDPCQGRVVDGHGYRHWRDGTAVPPSPPGRVSRDAWRSVEIRPAGSHARVRIPPEVQMDLGAIGKAWLADRLARIAAADLDCDVIADMGGDLRIIGAKEPWVIAADPDHDDHPPQNLEVTDCGLATSGTGRRTWTGASGQRVSHIIDPRSGMPAELVFHTASVLAVNARGANTAATTAVILGDAATPWLQARGLDAWLVGTDGTETRVGRWPGRETP